MIYLRVLLIGIYFGIVLVKSEVVRWERVHQMFMLQEAYMYLIITTSIIVGGISMFLIKRFEVKSVEGKPIEYKPKPYHTGVIIGGTLFGMGWAITGSCPGPLYAQIGAGEWITLFTFVGAFAGMYLYAIWRPSLPH
jgi:uncharacterized membrane protein YedE/YeeE